MSDLHREPTARPAPTLFMQFSLSSISHPFTALVSMQHFMAFILCKNKNIFNNEKVQMLSFVIWKTLTKV